MTFVESVRSVVSGSVLLQVAVILAATVVAAFALEWIVGRLVGRLTRRTRTNLDDQAWCVLHPAIRWTVLLLGLGFAFQRLEMGTRFSGFLASSGASILVLMWAAASIRVLSLVIPRLGGGGRFQLLQPRTVPLFDTVQKLVIGAGAAYLVFLAWHIDLTAWVASAGIVGIAVGFAAKDTLANLFSGIFILVDAPYKVGDMVVFESGERGAVTEVGLRSTRILTREDVEIIVPNSVIGSGRVTNESGGPRTKRRVDARVGVSYSSDIDRVEEILIEVAQGLDLACEDPEPRVRFREMGDSALVFSLLFWVVNPEDRGRALHEANFAIFKRFRDEGVEIPFPQRVVHHVGAPPAA